MKNADRLGTEGEKMEMAWPLRCSVSWHKPSNATRIDKAGRPKNLDDNKWVKRNRQDRSRKGESGVLQAEPVVTLKLQNFHKGPKI